MKLGLIGIQYRHPKLYSLLIPVIHRKAVTDTFRERVGKNVSVFDVAAGFGLMSRYIDPSNSYRGIDINERFVSHAHRQGLSIKVKDIFDKKAYIKSDVLILTDVIHHLPPEKLQDLFELVFANAKKGVVILEPAFLSLKDRFGILGAPVDWLMRKLDSDGVNKIDRWLTAEEYQILFETRFGSRHGKSFEYRNEIVYPYHLVTFSRRDDTS